MCVNKHMILRLSNLVIIAIISIILIHLYRQYRYQTNVSENIQISSQFDLDLSTFTCNTTIITSYYKIPSKHSHEEYLSWMTNFLSLPDCMVIFTQPDFVDTISKLRPSNYTSITLPRQISSFLVTAMLDDQGWEHQEKSDPEQHPGHNRNLYCIWNEKTNMMKIVADINPFSSSYFVWLDIGAVRHSDYNHQKMMMKVPDQKGVLLLSVMPFTIEEMTSVENRNLADFSHVNRIGGGTIGCDKESLEQWHKAYYNALRSNIDIGRFIGKDQNLMATICLQTDLCLLVEGDGEWFRLQEWFRGDIFLEPKRLNITNKGNQII